MRRLFLPLLLLAATALPAAPAAKPADPISGLAFRSIGPARGGRVTAVAGVRHQPLTYYFGATGGGVWKTTDGGVTWANVSDKAFRTGSVGALAVAESDPAIVFAGMGEAPIRSNASGGDGVYRSLDGGVTWTHLGLTETHHIARIRIHPRDPKTVWVAAQGRQFGPNPERGIYRSQDGGATWTRVLFVDDRTGACDLAEDPRNPDILYAAFWQVVRRPWELMSGGPGSSLWKSTDGGTTWRKLTQGLPEGILGKIGVAASGARPGRVWALVEHKTRGGLYRSDDYGETWTHVSDDHGLRERAWYYTWIYADPQAEDTVWAPNVQMHRSTDGGKSWTSVGTFTHGDHHDLWIDPDDPARMIVGNDGGATITTNGGRTWSTQMNQPTGQFYRVTTDDRWPYWIYGCQQDNTSVGMPSATPGVGIDVPDWHAVGGGESGWVAPDPRNPDIVYTGEYGGQVTRYDHRTGQVRNIMAWPQLGSGRATSVLKYRFNWNAPLMIDRHDPSILYHAAQKLLRSRDGGETWEESSPDLTRNDPATLVASGGPITLDVSGAEVYATIFALAESPLEKGQLWAGSDDGLVHLTRDGGATWTDLTPALNRAGLPGHVQINAIEASPHDPASAFVAATAYKWDDPRPLLFVTHDSGKTWSLRVQGLPADVFTRVVREDPARKGLLYAGTERGLYVSFDEGIHWRPLQQNFPAVPVTDLAVKRDDLVVATQGRGFWILDDLAPLRQWSDALAAQPLHLFQPAPVVRFQQASVEEGESLPPTLGANRPNGALLDLWLAEVPKAPLAVEILSGTTLLRRYSTVKPDYSGDLKARQAAEQTDRERLKEKPLALKPGLNRILWDMRILPPELAPRAVFDEGDRNPPRVAPGTYTVRVTCGGQVLTAELKVLANPALKVPDADLQAQFDLLKAIRDRLSENQAAVQRIRDLRGQVEAWGPRAAAAGKGGAVQPLVAPLATKLTALERRLTNPDIQADEDDLVYEPQLDHDWTWLTGVVAGADARPTAGATRMYVELAGQQAAVLGDLAALEAGDLAAFQKALEDAGLPRIAPAERP